jgi:ABC-type transport system involved in cytochrome c biogenesis permease subunit
VALASELAGIIVPARLRRILTLGSSAAGLAAHTIYLAHRAVADRICPLTTSYDSLLVLSWILAIVYLSVHWYYPRVTIGIFALPLIVGLVVLAAFLGEEGRRVLEGPLRVWGPVHGALLAIGAVAVFVGSVAGVMYLVQVRRLKGKHLPSELLDLPSLELLERINRQGITVAFPLLTIGFGIGLLLALHQRQEGVEGIRLLDPKVIFGVLVWVAFAVLLKVQSQPQFRGRKVAMLTIAGFCLLLFTMVGVDLLLPSWHRAVTGDEKGVRNLFLARPEGSHAQKVPDTFFGGAS